MELRDYKNLQERVYNSLVYTHDAVIGLINPPHHEYPYNMTGLLHAADKALIYCVEDYQKTFALTCREIATTHMLKKSKAKNGR